MQSLGLLFSAGNEGGTGVAPLSSCVEARGQA